MGDASGDWNVGYGIDNLFDAAPEVTDAAPWTAGSATNTNCYDILGRSYYVGLNLTF